MSKFPEKRISTPGQPYLKVRDHLKEGMLNTKSEEGGQGKATSTSLIINTLKISDSIVEAGGSIIK